MIFHPTHSCACSGEHGYHSFTAVHLCVLMHYPTFSIVAAINLKSHIERMHSV